MSKGLWHYITHRAEFHEKARKILNDRKPKCPDCARLRKELATEKQHRAADQLIHQEHTNSLRRERDTYKKAWEWAMWNEPGTPVPEWIENLQYEEWKQ